MERVPAEVIAFAEDPGAYVAVDPDEERILDDGMCVTFRPGEHFWSTSVCRVRFPPDGVESGLERVRRLMRERGRREAVWTLGPSSTPRGVADELIALGLERESAEGSVILTLTGPPALRRTDVEVRVVETFDDHLAALETAIEGFGFPKHDADDERRRARTTFEIERGGGTVVRFVASVDGVPVGSAHATYSPHGAYVGGVATVPSARGRGVMSAVIAAAWADAVGRGTPALVCFAGSMSAPTLQRLGFQAHGRAKHLIDRP
jgi:GNAT superfamily N-acetyltransferase